MNAEFQLELNENNEKVVTLSSLPKPQWTLVTLKIVISFCVLGMIAPVINMATIGKPNFGSILIMGLFGFMSWRMNRLLQWNKNGKEILTFNETSVKYIALANGNELVKIQLSHPIAMELIIEESDENNNKQADIIDLNELKYGILLLKSNDNELRTRLQLSVNDFEKVQN